jgi:hypothetical protein
MLSGEILKTPMSMTINNRLSQILTMTRCHENVPILCGKTGMCAKNVKYGIGYSD